MNLLLNPTSFNLWSFNKTTGGVPCFTIYKDIAQNPFGTDNLADLIVPDINAYGGLYEDIILQPNTTYWFSFYTYTPIGKYVSFSLNLTQGVNSIYWDSNTGTTTTATTKYLSSPTTFTQGSGYTPSYQEATYNNVTLTLVSGTPPSVYPVANIKVINGSVSTVTIVTPVTGGDNTTIYTATSNLLGGTGSGFTYSASTSTIIGGGGYTPLCTTVYPNVTLTYVSGTIVTTLPTANITVTAGKVVNVALVNNPVGGDITTLYSVAPSSIGGTGSGFSISHSALTGLTPYTRIVWNLTTPSTFVNTSTTRVTINISAPYPQIANASQVVIWGGVLDTSNTGYVETNMSYGMLGMDDDTVLSNTVSIDLKDSSGNLITTPFDPARYRVHNYNLLPFPDSYDLTKWTYTKSTLNTVTALNNLVAGSGYADGVYNNVQLVYNSGTAVTTCPVVNITVYNGSVSSVTLVTNGSGITSTTTTFTCSNTLLGNKGSGFSIAVGTIGSQAGLTITNSLYENPGNTSKLTSLVVSDTGSYGGVSKAITVSAGATYTLTFSANRINPNGSSFALRLRVSINNLSTNLYLNNTATSGYQTNYDNFVTAATAWTTYTYTYTVPANISSNAATLVVYMTGATSIVFYGFNNVLGNVPISYLEPYLFSYNFNGYGIDDDSASDTRFPSIDLYNSNHELTTVPFDPYRLAQTTYLGKNYFPWGNTIGKLVNNAFLYTVNTSVGTQIINDVATPPADIVNNPAYLGNAADLIQAPNDPTLIGSYFSTPLSWNLLPALTIGKQYVISCWVMSKYLPLTGTMSVSPGGNWNTGLQVQGSEGNLADPSWKTLNGSYSIILQNDSNNAGLYNDMGIPNVIPTNELLFTKRADQIRAISNNGSTSLLVQGWTNSTVYDISTATSLPTEIANIKSSVLIYQELAYDPNTSSYNYDLWAKYAADYSYVNGNGNTIVALDSTKLASITAWAVIYPMKDGTKVVKIFQFYGTLFGDTWRYQSTQAYSLYDSVNQDLTKPVGYGFFFTGYLSIYGGIRIYDNSSKTTPTNISILPNVWTRVSLPFTATLPMNNLTHFLDRPGNNAGPLFTQNTNSWTITAFMPTNPNDGIHTPWSPLYSSYYIYGIMINEGTVPSVYFPDPYQLYAYSFPGIDSEVYNSSHTLQHVNGPSKITSGGILAEDEYPHHHIGIDVAGCSYYGTAKIFLNLMKLSNASPVLTVNDPTGTWPAQSTTLWRLYRSLSVNNIDTSSNVLGTRLILNGVVFTTGSTTMTSPSNNGDSWWSFDPTNLVRLLIGTNVANNTKVVSFTVNNTTNLVTWVVDTPFTGNSSGQYGIKAELIDDYTILNLDSDGYPRNLPVGYYLYSLVYRTTPISFLLFLNPVAQLNHPILPTGYYTVTWDGEGIVALETDVAILPKQYPATLISSTSNSALYYVDTSGSAAFTTYTNITLSYSSGTRPSVMPVATLCVDYYAKYVSAVFVTTAPTGGDANTVYTVDNTLMGGTGNGFICKIDTSNHNKVTIPWGGQNYTANTKTSASFKYYRGYDTNGNLTLQGYTALNSETGIFTIIKSSNPNNNGNYVRNIKVFETQYADLVNAGDIFYPDFINRLADFKCLRFLDWMAGNSYQYLTSINSLTTESHVSWANGNMVPLSVIIGLCNLVKKDCWINIPVYSSDGDAYYWYIANLFQSTLDPSLRLYIEYGNEQWNGGLGPGYWITQAATFYGYDSTKVYSNPPNLLWYNHMFAYAILSQKVFNIFANVFIGCRNKLNPPRLWDNPKNQKRRLFRCLSTMQGSQSITSQIWSFALPYCTADFNIPYDVITPAGYYDIIGDATVNANTLAASPNEWPWTKEELEPIFATSLNNQTSQETAAAIGILSSTISTGSNGVLGRDSTGDLYSPLICMYEGGFGSAGPSPLMLQAIMQLCFEEDAPTNTVYNLSLQQFNWWTNTMLPMMSNCDLDAAVYNQWESSVQWASSGQWGLSDKSNYTDTQYYQFPRPRLYSQTAGRMGMPTITIPISPSNTYTSKPMVYVNNSWVYMSNFYMYNNSYFAKVGAPSLSYWNTLVWK